MSQPIIHIEDYHQVVYAGSIVYNIGYGCYLLLSISSIYMLWHQPRTPSRRVMLSYTLSMLAVNAALFILMSINTDGWLRFAEGDSDSDRDLFSVCGSGFILLQVFKTLPVLLSDLLLLFRAFHIVGRVWKRLAMPLTLYTLLLTLGVLYNLQCSYPAAVGDQSDRFLMGFIGASIVLNLVLTALVTRTLRRFRKSVYRVTNAGNTRNGGSGDPYSSVTAIVVESAAAWTVVAFVYLVALVVGDITSASPFSIAFKQALYVDYFFEYVFQIVVPLSPAILIFRVAINKHFVTPEELRTWEASHDSYTIDLEGRHHQRGQGKPHLTDGKATGRISSFSGPSTCTPPPRSISVLRFHSMVDSSLDILADQTKSLDNMGTEDSGADDGRASGR